MHSACPGLRSNAADSLSSKDSYRGDDCSTCKSVVKTKVLTNRFILTSASCQSEAPTVPNNISYRQNAFSFRNSDLKVLITNSSNREKVYSCAAEANRHCLQISLTLISSGSYNFCF